MIEMLDYPIYLIAGLYKPDFGDLNGVIKKFSVNKTVNSPLNNSRT